MSEIKNYKELINHSEFTNIINDIINTIETPIKKYKIHISNLSYKTKVFDIRQLCNKNEIKIKKIKHFKKRGFCYIELFNIKDFIKFFTIKEILKGRNLIIKKARK